MVENEGRDLDGPFNPRLHPLRSRKPAAPLLGRIRTRTTGARLIKTDRRRATTDLVRIPTALHETVPQHTRLRRAVRRDAVPAVTLAAVLKARVLGSLALAEVDARLDGHAVPARLRDVERAGSSIVDAAPDILPALRPGYVRVAEGGGSRAGDLGDGAVGDRDGGRRAGGDRVAAGQRGQDAVDLFVDL